MQSHSICIIPARGGSKRIPRKNLIDFNGKPMIAWPIVTALECGIFSQVLVSTDDSEIAGIARDYGAEVPFVRDAALADDFATTADVLADAVRRCGISGTACCLYPTATMLEAADLRSARDALEKGNADCVLAVSEFDYHPLRALQTASDGSLEFRWPEHELTRSQDLPELKHDAGMFYFFRAENLLRTGRLLDGRVLGVPIPRSRCVDIDTPEDLDLARTLHARRVDAGKGGQ